MVAKTDRYINIFDRGRKIIPFNTMDNELRIIITAILAVLGACVASFINVAALRGAKGESFVAGRSRCPKCGAELRWFELIPVISWLIQAGRCRRCKVRISPRYLIVEIVGAASSAMCFVRYGLTWMTPLALVVTLILLAVALFDAGSMEIPNGLVIALIPLAVLSIWAQPGLTLLSRGIGIFTVSLPMLLLALVINGAFGGGDIKLMAVCGFLLGWQNTVLAFFVAVVTAGIIVITLIARGKAKKGAHIAFGPHLCLGVAAAMLYGKEIINWYLRLFGI